MIDDHAAHQLEAEYWERLDRFATAWRYYRGEHDPPIATQQDAVVVNNAGSIVDIGVDFLFGTAAGGQVLEFRADAGTDEATARVQQLLDQVWRANRKNTLLREVSLNGGVTGHPWIRLAPPAAPGLPPRIVNVDPANVSVAWDPADYTHLRVIRVEWVTLGPNGWEAWREDHTRDDGGRSWTITTSTARVSEVMVVEGRLRQPASWQVTSTETWPHSWPALVSCQNLPRPNEFWGSSDVEHDVRALNDALNRVASDAKKTLRHFGHPKPVGYGFDASSVEFDAAIGDMLVIPSKDGRIENLQMQSDLAAAHQMMEWLDSKQWERSGIPKVAAGRVDNVGALSSLALEILYRPLVAKTNTKRDLYGDMLRLVCDRVLELAGVSPGTVDVELVWPDVLPKNEREAVETAAIVVERVGGSQSTQLAKLGMDPEEELEQKRQEETAGLGAGVALGGLFADLAATPPTADEEA